MKFSTFLYSSKPTREIFFFTFKIEKNRIEHNLQPLTPSIKSFCRYISKFIARSCLWSLLWLDLTCSLRVYEDESLFPLWCQNSSSSIVSTNLLSICCFFSILKWLPVLQANFSSESALSLFARASGFLILKGTGGIFKFNF